MMLAVVLGLAAGFVHVLSGPDHLASVAPLVAAGRRRTWVAGFLWGVGHTSGFWIVGLLALLLRELLPWESMASWSDHLASAGLMAIGLWGFYRVLGPRRRRSDSDVPVHAACLLGILHGLAGSSHYLGVLPVLAFTARTAALAYLCSFGLATIGTMVAFACALGSVVERAAAVAPHLQRWLRLGCAGAALGIGGILLVL